MQPRPLPVQLAGCAIAAVLLASCEAPPRVLADGPDTPPPILNPPTPAHHKPERKILIEDSGLLEFPDGRKLEAGQLGAHPVGAVFEELTGPEWALYNSNGDLLLDREDAHLLRPFWDHRGEIRLPDGRFISRTGDLVVDELVLPSGSILIPSADGTVSIRCGAGSMPGSVKDGTYRAQLRRWAEEFSIPGEDNAALAHLPRAVRAHLQGPLFQAVEHLGAESRMARLAIRRDGVLVLEDGMSVWPDGSSQPPKLTGLRFLQGVNMDGSERRMNHPTLTVPAGSVLMPDGRLIAPSGHDITPATRSRLEQFPVKLEGVLYRAVPHLRVEDAPDGTIIRLRPAPRAG